MDRREFAKALSGTALGAAVSGGRALAGSLPAPTAAEAARVPYKTSVMLWTVFQKLPFEERLEKVAEAGFHAVELVNEFVNWSEDDFRKANQKRRELGITFDTLLGGSDLANPSKRDAFLADVRKQLSIAQKLDCPTMICMSGNVVPGMTPGAQHQSIVEGLKRGADVVEGRGVTLLLENIDLEENPRYYLWSVPEAMKIIQEVNHPQVKFLYDFFHAQISGGNLITHLERHFDTVGLVHIADVPGRHEPGTGEINYSNIYKKLAELKYRGYVAMEFIPRHDPVLTLRAACEEALRAGRV
jgi:hydroxypyruvate isomerase